LKRSRAAAVHRAGLRGRHVHAAQTPSYPPSHSISRSRRSAKDGGGICVAFLTNALDAAAEKKLLALTTDIDQISRAGREMYWLSARSKANPPSPTPCWKKPSVRRRPFADQYDPENGGKVQREKHSVK